MGEYTIEEDRVKLTLYTAGNLCLTLILMFICAESVSYTHLEVYKRQYQR